MINVDDPYGARLAAELGGPVTFALDTDATYRAAGVQTGLGGSRFTVHGPDGDVELSSPLRGRFNVYNVLGAFAAARELGVPAARAVEAIGTAGQVPGRFETIEEGQSFAVLVDYAHTPDSLENVLRAARPLSSGRVHVVFGAGGDRDRTKRPLMGEIATRLADRVIVTSDNPRSEPPEAIIDEILHGARGTAGEAGGPVEQHVDRREAIAIAIAGAETGDVVVIAGKGHEQGQEFADGHKVPFDDATVAREAPEERGPGSMRSWSRAADRAGGRCRAARPRAAEDGSGPDMRRSTRARPAPERCSSAFAVGAAMAARFAAPALDAGAWGVPDGSRARRAGGGAGPDRSRAQPRRTR